MRTTYPTLQRRLASLGCVGSVLASVAVSKADIAYVSDWNDNTIRRYDTATGADLGIFVNGIDGGPRGLAVDSAGNLYAVIWGTQSIMKFTPDGVGSVFASGLPGPESLAFDNSGNLYVGNVGNNTVMKFTPDGTGSVYASAGLNEPDGLAFDKRGNLYVANGRGNDIEWITPNGLVTHLGIGLQYPFGLAFDRNGKLYVSNYWGPYYGGASITTMTPDGVNTPYASGMADPAGIAFDSAGNLFVADEWGGNYGRILEVSPTGVTTLFADIPYGGPVAIAIQYVPEPAGVALLGVGLASLLGFRFRGNPNE